MYGVDTEDAYITGNYGLDTEADPVAYCEVCGDELYLGDQVINTKTGYMCMECLREEVEQHMTYLEEE